jgi:hypothetical protein
MTATLKVPEPSLFVDLGMMLGREQVIIPYLILAFPVQLIIPQESWQLNWRCSELGYEILRKEMFYIFFRFLEAGYFLAGCFDVALDRLCRRSIHIDNCI